MDSNLDKLRSEIQSLRQSGGVKPDRLIRLAKRLGRTKAPRGKHPTWVHHLIPDTPPLSIPDHGGRELNRFTARAILDQLEEDLERFAEMSREPGTEETADEDGQ